MAQQLEDHAKMVRLGLSTPEERYEYESNKREYNKTLSEIYAEARNSAKADSCLYCGEQCTSFCNSHSIPKFALKNIADHGKVFATLQGEVPKLGDDIGVNKAGTFHIICRSCDSKIFQEYEDPCAYEIEPSDKMLAQIALKNYMQLISKRHEETALFRIAGERKPQHQGFTSERQRINDYDLKEYMESFDYAKKALTSASGNSYYLCYYHTLDYVVPYATQSAICMIADFGDKLLNNTFNFSPNYHTKEIHVAVFPLESKSVIFMFIPNGDKRYRNFYKTLKKLPLEDQLATINYIIFSYTENVYLNKDILAQMQQNPMFMDTCRKSVDFVATAPFFDPVLVALDTFSLNKRHEIPNLLSPEYALK